MQAYAESLEDRINVLEKTQILLMDGLSMALAQIRILNTKVNPDE